MSKILSDEDGDTIWNEHFTEDELRHPHVRVNAKLDTGTPTNSKHIDSKSNTIADVMGILGANQLEQRNGYAPLSKKAIQLDLLLDLIATITEEARKDIDYERLATLVADKILNRPLEQIKELKEQTNE